MLTALVVGFVTLTAFTADFERHVIEGDFHETTSGTVYYQNSSKVTVEVNDPIEQMMIVDGKVMDIYYPQEGKVFRIKSKMGSPPPLVQGIITAIKGGDGLTEMGYTLAGNKKKEDILYTYWEPPKKMKKFLGIIILGMKKGRVVYTEARTPEGEVVSKSFYQDYIKFGNIWLPSDIYSESYRDSNITKEHIVYKNFTPHIPKRVLNFSLPTSIHVKEIKW
ncbi:MAG: outer-membrane lipoprotein carrier protein LolA [bacterium]|nr:outer-membrane lipoprotein carrier protein LolA [bacterium]